MSQSPFEYGTLPTMAGKVRARCNCGTRFDKESRCPKCGALPTRYFVDLHYRGNRIRIYCDDRGIPLDSIRRAERVLEAARYEIDCGRFDPSRYVKKEREEYEFHSRMEKWVRDYESRCGKGDISPSYLRIVKRYARLYYLPHFGNADLRDTHTRHLKEFADSLPNTLSPKTRKNILDTLRKFFNDMVALEIIDKAPLMPLVKVPEPSFNWCSMETQEAILNEIPRRHHPYLYFIAKQGVRPGEARALQWGDVDLKSDMVCIKRTYSENTLRETTKGRHADWLPLVPEVKRLLEGLPRGTPKAFVFRYKGRPYSESLARKLWNRACRKLDITGLTLYQGTRHSIGSSAAQRGETIYDIMDALRHRDIRTTMKYAHMDLEGKRRVLLRGGVVELKKPSTNRPQEG